MTKTQLKRYVKHNLFCIKHFLKSNLKAERNDIESNTENDKKDFQYFLDSLNEEFVKKKKQTSSNPSSNPSSNAVLIFSDESRLNLEI